MHDPWVPSRSKAIESAIRLVDRTLNAVSDELREARLTSGLAQSEVGRALGVSRMRVSRVERRKLRSISLEYVARHAAVVGLRLSVRLYPVGGGLRDRAQARYIARFVERIGHIWRVQLDVPIPLPGDLRGIDVYLTGACTIAVEVITRLTDLQALLRAAQLKQRDIGATRLILVVAGTHANRRALDEARSTLLATFDLDTRRTMERLAAGDDPGRDAIVVLE